MFVIFEGLPLNQINFFLEGESLTLRLGSNTSTSVNIYKTLDSTFADIIEFLKSKKMFREAEKPFQKFNPRIFWILFYTES